MSLVIWNEITSLSHKEIGFVLKCILYVIYLSIKICINLPFNLSLVQRVWQNLFFFLFKNTYCLPSMFYIFKNFNSTFLQNTVITFLMGVCCRYILPPQWFCSSPSPRFPPPSFLFFPFSRTLIYFSYCRNFI